MNKLLDFMVCRRITARGTAAVVLAAGLLATATACGGSSPPLRSQAGPAKPAGRAAASHVSVSLARGVPFVVPTLPPSSAVVDPVPVSRQSLGELLIGELPAGARYRNLQAIVQPAADGGVGVSLTARSVTGAGVLSVSLMSAGTASAGFFQCGSQGSPCHTYRLAGGVLVNEIDSQAPNGDSIYVTVLRPGIALVALTESTGKALSGVLPPLSLAQAVAAALDPRWRFTVSRQFAARASHLHVGLGRAVKG